MKEEKTNSEFNGTNYGGACSQKRVIGVICVSMVSMIVIGIVLHVSTGASVSVTENCCEVLELLRPRNNDSQLSSPTDNGSEQLSPTENAAFTQNLNCSTMKTIQLCKDLKPGDVPATYNQDEMKDIIGQAAKNFELRIKEQERWDQGEGKWVKGPLASERSPVGTKTPALGSSDMVTYPGHDAGLFSTIVEAYNRHFNLRTGPEDWWYCIIRTVALAIDKNSKKEEVRKFFVEHDGKKTLTVKVPETGGVDYSWFFDQMSQQIAKNINVPDYVDKMKTDFSQSTNIHKIVSEVTLMSSVQEFFEFRMVLGCGIPAIEMKGTQQDWERLVMKITELKHTLKPLEDVIGLKLWWDKAEKIAGKLLDTYNGYPDEDWWSRIITHERYGSGGQVALKGWFMVDFLNCPGATDISDAPSGIVSVPMKIAGFGYEEDSAVVAGMIGYKLHVGDQASVPTVEPAHGWSLLLEPNSVFTSRIQPTE